MAEQVTDPPVGGTVIDLGKKVKAKYPEYANLSDEEVGRKVKAKYPDAYGNFTDTPSFQTAPQPMTTPLPGAAAGPSIGVGTQQVASPTPSSVQQPQFDAAGEALANTDNLEPEPLAEADRQAYLRSLAGEPDSATPARVRNAILDRNAASRAVGQEYTVPSGTAGVFTRNAGLPIGPPDERDQAIRYDYAKSLGMRNELGVMRDITERLNAGADSGLDRYAKFQFDALDHASTKLEGRANRVYALLDQGVPPEQLQSEIADIQDAEGYLQERKKWLVQNLPKSETQRIIEQRQKEAQEYEKDRGVGGTIREGARITGIGFGESLLSGAAGLARVAAELTGTSDGYDWSDKFSDFADATVRKQTAYLPPEWNQPLSQVVEEEQADGTKKAVEKYNIMPTLLRGAGGMGGLVVGAGATGRVGSLLGKLTGRGLATTGAVNPLGAAALTDAAMGVGAQGGRTAGMFFPEFDGQMRRAIDAGADEGAAVIPAAAYALASAVIEEFNPQAYIKVPGLKSQLQKSFVDAIKEGVPANAKVLITHVAKKAGNEGLKEALETAAQKGSEIAANRVTNAISGSGLEEDVSARDFVNEVASAFVLGSAFGTVAHASDGKKMRQTTAEAMRFAAENPAVVEQMIATQVPPAEQDKFKERLDRLAKTYKGNGLSDLPTKKGATVASAIEAKTDVEADISAAPMDPAMEAAKGDPRKRKVNELTKAILDEMGMTREEAQAAKVAAGVEKAPEGTKVVKNPDGSVTLEKKPEAGEKKAKKAVASVFTEEPTGEEPTAAPAESSEVDVPVSTEAAIEPTTNEDQPTPEATAAAPAEDPGAAPGVPLDEHAPTEPVATDLTEDLPDDPKALADAYYEDHQIWNSNANPEYAMINAMKGRVKESSYDEWGDPNDKGNQMSKTYFAKKGAKAWGLDQIAQELTEELGREVAPDELAELMRANQSGLPRTSPRMRQTADRYKAITGKRLTVATGARQLKQKGRSAVKDADTKDFIDQHTDQDGNVNWQGVKDNIHALGFLGYTDEQARELEAEADRQLAANAGGGEVLAAVPEIEADAGRGIDEERAILEETLVGARKELEAYERYFKKQAESLFDKDAVESRKRGVVKRAEPSMFEADGDTRANSAEDMEAGAKTLRDRVALAEKALADYDAQGAARAQAAAQQMSIDQAPADNIPVSKPEKAMSSASRFRPRKRVEFDTPIKGPSGAVLKAYEWQYEFEEYIDDRGEERVRRVSDWNKAELSDETGRDIVHQFEVVTPDGIGYLVSAESALKMMGYMEANASVKSKMSAAKALAGLLMNRQVLQEEVARRKAVEDEVDSLQRPEITKEDKSENEELRGFGREESKNRINQIWRMGDASIWASFRKDDPLLNSEKEERAKTLVRSWKDNRLKERGVKPYENPSAKLREVEKKIATKERQLGAKATDVSQETPTTGAAEAAARRAAAILERAKLKGDQLYALPLPPSVWNGAIRAMQEVIIAGGKAVDAIAAAIKHIQQSDWWKNKATQDEKDETMGYLQGRISDLETAIAAEDVASLKENIQQARATGAQNTRTKQQEARKEFVQAVKDSLEPLRGRMTPAQVKSITAAAAKVNPASPQSVSRFERVAAKVMARANYADDLSRAKESQKRAKKLAKQADVPLNHRESLKAIGKVDVGMLDDPASFTGPVQDYLQQFGAIGKNYQPGSSEAIIEAMGKLQEQTMAEYRNMLMEEFGVEAGSVDPQQLYDALESDDFDAFAKNLEEAKKKEVADAIRQVADYSKMGLESYENEDLSATEKKTLDTLRGIDIDLLSTDQQKEYIKTADNITLNDAFYGAGRMEAVAKATEGLAAAERAVKSTPLRKVWTTSLKEMYQQQFASVSGMFRFLFGQGEGMAKFHDAIGMTDLILGKKKVDDAVSKAGEKMADFYTNLRKKYKDADTDTMRAAEGIAAYVLQPIPNVGLEESFGLRKQQVADSIAAKAERTKRQDEADVEQRAFDLVLGEATTRDELIRAMKAKAPSAWASVDFLANEVLKPHAKDVLEHRENFWNEAVDVDNPMYLPISYRFLTSAQIAEDAPGQFGAAEKLRKPKESANLIKRESVKTLPRDRVIDMNVRRNTLNALERNLYDTYTSPAWQRMREFFRLPKASKVVGGIDNSDFMQARLNDLRSAQMREGPKADNLERAVSAITNTVRKAASQIALGGFTQAIKQPADQLTSAMVNVGPEMVGKSILEVKKAEPLLQLTSIGDRGELMGGTNWDNTLEAETAAMARALKGNKMERFEAATERYRRFLMSALTKSDVLSARTAWLAYYQKYLADKGIEVGDWQQEADMVKDGDPVRREALAFAEVNADITQGSSDPTKQAKIGQRSPQAWANLLKAAFNPFSSFAIGMRERIINDASDLMFYGGKQMYDADGKRTKEGDRAATAGRSLVATLSSNIMFTVAKVYIAKSLIALGAEGLRAAFSAAAGGDDDKEKKGLALMSLMMNILYTMRLMDADVYRMFSTAYREQKKDMRMSDEAEASADQAAALRNAKVAYTSIMQSMLVSGFSPFAENALVDGINWGSYMMQGAMGDLPTAKTTGAPLKYDYWVKQPEYPPLYRYGQGYHESNYGVFSVILDRASELQEQAKDATGFGGSGGDKPGSQERVRPERSERSERKER